MDTFGDIATAKQRKSKLQVWVTRICGTARDCLSTGAGNAAELLGIYNNLKSKYDNYKAACEHLVDLIEDNDELNTVLTDMTAYDNEVEMLLAQLSVKKSPASDHPPTSVSGQSTSDQSASGQSTSATSSSNTMKLPKLELRPFSGEATMWPEFWDLFQVAVHANSQVPTVQKFTHLKSLLRGEAAKCIASIPTTASNYDVAIERLQSRYGKPEVLRHRLLTKITEMKHLENYKTLRDGVDDLTATVRALEVQGVSHTEYGTLLMPIVEARMPKAWKLLWARKKTAEVDVTFNDLIKFLETEVEVKELADRDNSMNGASKRREEVPRASESHLENMPTATALHIKPTLKCTFCGDNHKSCDCTVPMNVDDRSVQSMQRDAGCPVLATLQICPHVVPV